MTTPATTVLLSGITVSPCLRQLLRKVKDDLDLRKEMTNRHLLRNGF